MFFLFENEFSHAHADSLILTFPRLLKMSPSNSNSNVAHATFFSDVLRRVPIHQKNSAGEISHPKKIKKQQGAKNSGVKASDKRVYMTKLLVSCKNSGEVARPIIFSARKASGTTCKTGRSIRYCTQIDCIVTRIVVVQDWSLSCAQCAKCFLVALSNVYLDFIPS